MDAPHIEVEPPGPKTRQIVDRDHAAVVTTTKTTPVAAHRAEGFVVEDVDGNRYLDFAAGIGVLNTGHRHPRVVEAIKAQCDRFMHFAGTDFYYAEMADYAERLVDVAPGDTPKKVFYANSGTEAVEACLKMSRWSSRRPLVMGFLGAFHGRTAGALTLTASKPQQRARFSSVLSGGVHAPYPDPYRNPWGIDGYDEPDELVNRVLDYIRRWLFQGPAPVEDLSGILVEPIQGEGGYIVPPDGFMPALRELADEHGVHLIADEVQTGFGRTGRMFACDHVDVEPDMLALAKGIASGMPMGAAVVKAEYDFGVQGAHSNTYGGNPVACAAAMATLDVLEDEGLAENAAKVGAHLNARLDELAEDDEGIGDVRGRGLMLAVDLVEDRSTREPDVARRDAVVQDCARRGLILLPCGPSALRLLPPLTVTTEACDTATEVIAASLKQAK